MPFQRTRVARFARSGSPLNGRPLGDAATSRGRELRFASFRMALKGASLLGVGVTAIVVSG